MNFYGKSRLSGDANEKGNNFMSIESPICREHQISKEWRQTTFEYNEDGIRVRIPGVYAWVCPTDGDSSYTPETVDELIVSVREFIESAKRARTRRSAMTEYIVSVAA